MITGIFTRTFSAAHRIADDDGPCQRIHGHNYVAEIIVEVLNLDENGFTVPADEIKLVVDSKYDHKLILAEDDDYFKEGVHMPRDWIVRVPGPPSTERLAAQIARDVKDLDVRIMDVSVTLYETATISAHATA